MWLGPLLWYLLISVLGIAALPVAFYFFPGLRDRGYAFSRTLGLLLWAYLFWLLSSLGVLPNTVGGYLFSFLLLLGLSAFLLRKISLASIVDWFTRSRKLILTVEILFAVAFIFLLVLRGMEPQAVGTEKPMELAFINSILRSPSMPPRDPWLAGYSISYYYFGYVMVAMMAKMTGVSGGVAFNLGISLVFALGAVGAYGLVYNLLAAFKPAKKSGSVMLPLLGPLFIFIVSNVEGFLEFLHGHGVFWTQNADGSWTSDFWTKLQILNLSDPPPGNTTPNLRFWWWWRASRVVSDFDYFGNFWEVIDEFPFFSFFLGDLHPHVLGIPFVFLALALSLNLILNKEEGDQAGQPRFRIFNFEYLFSPAVFLLGGLVFGGLGFLNLWDFPWYVGVFAGAHLLRKIQEDGWGLERGYEFLLLGLAYGILGVVLYLPFYLGFSSQAGGILPNVINPTRGAHLWIMFGTLFVPIFFFLIYLLVSKRRGKALLWGLGVTVGGVALLYGFSLLLTSALGRTAPGDTVSFLNSFYMVDSVKDLLREGTARRIAALFGLVTLVGLLTAGLGVLWPEQMEEDRALPVSPSTRFAALLVVVGTLLVLVPEFVYLKDLFLKRMNTIFKFYYQAWMMLGIAAAYGSAVLLSNHKKMRLSLLYTLVFVVVLFVGLTYPVMAMNTKISTFQSSQNGLELDSTAHFYYLNADEKAAVAWLSQAPIGTLVESVGDSYSQHARISTHSGQPALLGWIGHEGQWRGGDELFAGRIADITQLYTTRFWEEASMILQKYNIRYVVVGNLEYTTYQGETYRLEVDKFEENLKVAFRQGSITIYETSGWDD